MPNFKAIRPSFVISRLLCALISVYLIVILGNGATFLDASFYSPISFPIFAVLTTVIFILLCLVSSQQLIHRILIGTATVYFFIAAWQGSDYYFSFGLSAVLCIGIYFFDPGQIKLQLSRTKLIICCGVMIAAFILWVGITSCLYYWEHATSCFDLGIFSQIFYNMKQTGQMLSTCERDALLNHFAVHTSPILYVLLPIYALFPDPATLLICQAVLVASGAIPLVLICRKYGLSRPASVAFAVCYLLLPGFIGGCFYHFHENCFLPALLLWFLYFSEKENPFLSILFALLTMLVKEDAPMYIAAICLYLIAAKKNRLISCVIFLMSVAYFLVVTALMSRYGEGIMTDTRFPEYIHDGGGLMSFVKNVIQNPVFAIKQIFTANKLLFLLQLLVPLCFLPGVTKKPERLLLIIPLLLVNLMTNYLHQYDVSFQYVFGTGSIVLYMAVINYADLGPKRSKALLCAVLSSILIFSGGFLQRSRFYTNYRINEEQRQVISSAFAMIPEDASVVCATYYLPALSQRSEIYELDATEHTAQYYVLDLRGHGYPEYQEKLLTGDYDCLVYEEGLVAIFIDPNY